MPRGKKKTVPEPKTGRKLIERKSIEDTVGTFNADKRIVKMAGSDCVVRADDFDLFDKKKIFLRVVDVEMNFLPVIGGRMCLIGEESSGKTLLSHIFEAALQKTCRQCGYPIIAWQNPKGDEVKTTCKCGANDPMVGIHVDIEDSFDPRWARRWGVRIGDETMDKKGYKIKGGRAAGLWVVVPEFGDYGLDFTIATIDDGSADFIVLDSVAFINPKVEAQKLVGEVSQPMRKAAFIAKWVTHLVGAQIGSKLKYGAPATLLWTNQYYMSMQRNPRADPRVESGGLRIRQASTNRMRIIYAHPEKSQEVGPKSKSRYLDVKFVSIKSKSRTPWAAGEYRLFLDNFETKAGVCPIGTSDDPDRLVTYLEMVGLFEKTKKEYICLGRSFKRIADIVNFLRREDIAYICRYFILRSFLPTSAQDYLLETDYAWSPWGPDPAFELFKDAKPVEVSHEKGSEDPDGGEDAGEDEGSGGDGAEEAGAGGAAKDDAFTDEDLFG